MCRWPNVCGLKVWTRSSGKDTSWTPESPYALPSNAIKFRRADEPPVVTVSAEHGDVEWVVIVRDNGIGVDPAKARQIFDVFQRLHSQDEYGGTGMGLAICKRIVERHGGRIWVEPVPTGGSEFKFTLPG